jgi:hypothetical protein
MNNKPLVSFIPISQSDINDTSFDNKFILLIREKTYIIEHPFEYWFQLKDYLTQFFNNPTKDNTSIYIELFGLKSDFWFNLSINFYIINYKSPNSSAQKLHKLLSLELPYLASEFYYDLYKKLKMLDNI